MSENEPWARKDADRLATVIVVVVAVGGVVAFLLWLNHFISGVGF